MQHLQGFKKNTQLYDENVFTYMWAFQEPMRDMYGKYVNGATKLHGTRKTNPEKIYWQQAKQRFRRKF